MCKKAETYLKKQTDNAGLAQGLPKGTSFGHKTGTLDANRHDAGIIYASEPYVIAFFSDGNDTDTANDLMNATARAVHAVLGA